MIATDKRKPVKIGLENAIAQPKESLATNAINVIEQTNIMEIQSKTLAFVSFSYDKGKLYLFSPKNVQNNQFSALISIYR